MGFKLRPGTSVFGNVTFTPGTNENYVAPPIHQGPPPMTVGWSNAGLSESERVAPAANGMQLYRHDQPYTNVWENRTLHNLPEYLEGLPFTVESASSSAENGIQGTPQTLEEYTFNTSGTLYLLLVSGWGGYDQGPDMDLSMSEVSYGGNGSPYGVLDPSAWTLVEHSVSYLGGGGDYGTHVFSRSVEAGTQSLNNLYYYAFKADAPSSAAPAPSEPLTTYLTNAAAQNISGDGAWGVGAVSNIGAWTGTFDASTGKYTKTSTGMWDSFLDSIDLSGFDQGDEFWFIVGAENMSTEFSNRGYMWNWARTSSESPKFFPVDDGGTAYIQVRSDTGQFEDNVGNFTPLNINLESDVIGAHTQLLLANRYTKSTGKMDTWYSTENPSIGIENITWTKLYNYDLTPGESLTEIKLGGLVRQGTGQVIRLWDASADNVPVQPSSPSAPAPSIVTEGLVFHVDAGNTSSYSGSGTTWTDLSGNGIDGTLVNGPTYSSDDGGKIVFDNSDDYINFASPSLAFGTSPFAMEIWVKVASAPDQFDQIMQGRNPDATSVFWGYRSGNLDFVNNNDTYPLLRKSWPTQGEWTHLVVTRDASNIVSLYRNGVLDGDSNYNAMTFDQTEMTIGSSFGYNVGREVGLARLYVNKGLSAEEVTQNYDDAKSRFGH